MTIGQIGPIGPLQNDKPGRAGTAARPEKGDSVHISTQAKEMALHHAALTVVNEAPDVRAARIAELKAKIDDPSYITNAILAGAADNIIDLLLPSK